MSSVMVPLDSVGPLVRDAMLHAPRTCGPDTTVAEARVQFESPLVLLLLVTRDGKLIGGVDRADVAERDGDETLGEIASRRFPEVRPDEPVARAMELLEAGAADRLPVVEDDGTLVGLICLNRGENRFCVDADRAS
ncbi:MAG: CBS domain-containing protein [Solirubrobacteraceae bacterium]|nr:CBS domain-containing protein [Solirubrobacteraceae bacterium]